MSIQSKIRNFIRRAKKKARKDYIKRNGFLAQGFQVERSESVMVCQRKYMQLRDPQTSHRGMDGTMR
ncbi:MAG: hypothetical protein E4H01_05985 [Lysobacterales bacterium]|nr:MAG: hypothetical protein E4H01_05985 [Xanthomonadales bacterium]